GARPIIWPRRSNVATSERSDIGRRQAIRTLARGAVAGAGLASRGGWARGRRAIRTLARGAVAAVASASWVESLTALARQQAHTHAAVAVIAAQNWAPRTLTAHQNDLVVARSELIIPQSTTPDARVAQWYA